MMMRLYMKPGLFIGLSLALLCGLALFIGSYRESRLAVALINDGGLARIPGNDSVRPILIDLTDGSSLRLRRFDAVHTMLIGEMADRLLYVSRRLDRSNQTTVYSLNSYTIPTERSRMIYELRIPLPAFSRSDVISPVIIAPNGRDFVFLNTYDNSLHLGNLYEDGTRQLWRSRVRENFGAGFTDFQWSPDGRHIAINQRDMLLMLTVIDLEGNILLELDLDDRELGFYTWSWTPDSQSILISSSERSSMASHLRLINVQTGQPDPAIAALSGSEARIHPCESGDWLVYYESDIPINRIVMQHLGTGERLEPASAPLLQGRDLRFMGFAMDCHHVLLIEGFGAVSNLYLAELKGNTVTTLAENAHFRQQLADGSLITMKQIQPGSIGIYQLIPGNPPQTKHLGFSQTTIDRAINWHDIINGQNLLYVSFDSAVYRYGGIMQLNLLNGVSSPVTPEQSMLNNFFLLGKS